VDELLNMNLSELDTPETLALLPERYARIQSKEPVGFEVEHYHKDGHIVPMDVASSAIDIDGKLYALAFHRDITERKRAEQELRRSQRELRGLSKAANEALEAERRRTARELHDELGQLLTALKMDLASLRSALPPDEPELATRAQAMNAMLDTTIAATRRIAADLRPLMLDDLGLAAALDWLTHNFSKHTGIATDLVIDETVAQVPEPIASALYRITQESLTNVTKYAQASTTVIRLERDGDWVQLSVRDNGRGIDAADQNKRGTYGLLGIRERVMLLSGEVTIRGEPGGGSEVCARIPLAAAQEQEEIT
jgi:signal transduction histidine kinase